MNASRETATDAMAPHVTVDPLSVHTGAEIHGVDLSKPLSALEVQTIRSTLLRWRVVFFREQHLDHAQHIAFARQFGELTPAHVVFGALDGHPEIYSVSKQRKSFGARPLANRVWTDWHSDVTAAVNPPFGSILRAVVVPPYGGDTQFTNMVAAYQGLSPAMQEFLATLRAVHRFKIATGGDDASDYNTMVRNNPIVAEHPLVTVHPETGERALFTNQEFVDHIVGLTASESDALLEYLWEHCVLPEYVARFRWKEGSIAFWDNRTTQHLAIRDVYDTDFDRQYYRVTLNGSIPVGVDGQASRHISGAPITPI